MGFERKAIVFNANFGFFLSLEYTIHNYVAALFVCVVCVCAWVCGRVGFCARVCMWERMSKVGQRCYSGVGWRLWLPSCSLFQN